jgi:NADPH-dependent glutamate synthase beta subunit-like oxidoreductase
MVEVPSLYQGSVTFVKENCIMNNLLGERTAAEAGCSGTGAGESHPAPCQEGCPLGTDIPSYVSLIWQGNLEAAFQVISANNPFSSICGRVCAMPCESRCRRGESDGPVAIRGLKRFVADQVGQRVHLPPVPVSQSKTVGIVGGGPTGLTAAQDLAEAGYTVHIYEKSESLGGMMARGIPTFRLPRRFIEQDIERIVEHCPGITVHTRCALGEDVTLSELKERHDVVLLAIGLWEDRRLEVPGEDDVREGLHGIGFLTDVNRGAFEKLEGRAVVIGGGNVAIDMARAALRAGSSEVEITCLEARDEMPAWEHEIGEALQEGVVLNPSWGPKRILHENGRVTGVELIRCTSVFDGDGAFNPCFDPKQTKTVPCRDIILAIGLSARNEELERLGILERGRVKADFETMQTADPRVFAAGDGAFGPSAIVHAIHHGHRAAHYMKAHLQGLADPEPFRIVYTTARVPIAQDPLWEKLPREEPIHCGVGADPSAMTECTLTYDAETARRQAARCLRCDAETGTANYTRRTRDLIHAMARTEPGDVGRLRSIMSEQFLPRENPFPPDRPAQLDDLVFIPAGLTRLVIDPYREHCSTLTPMGRGLSLQRPFFFTGFDDAPETVRAALGKALSKSGCGYIGRRPPSSAVDGKGPDVSMAAVPWIQLILPGEDEPYPEASGLLYVMGERFQPVTPSRVRDGQLLGMVATAPAFGRVIPFGLESGFDFLLLDGTGGIERSPRSELDGAPDLKVLRDAVRILRELNREEELALVYYGGLRSGTDVAKVLAVNCMAGVFCVAMAIAMGASVENGAMRFREALTLEEIESAAEKWIKATTDEAAIIARCTGKTNVHNLEPEDMRSITLAAAEATDIPLASGRPPREYF